ncbi:alpha-keto acid decarboxylase family protein [Subtercola endophyticus]|uniref:alpha-keto acid decarboxylase family protein n=1 Tax=Subtercola endophyticus TaxID=2895559 RepID=UPI001E4E9794|nr:thiamine pyrophosphate-binding protein [Subtercola endophyticus]UFS57902.1 thiamine pyrophosphate-dependent enzyme [Subtercola endophyticus]
MTHPTSIHAPQAQQPAAIGALQAPPAAAAPASDPAPAKTTAPAPANTTAPMSAPENTPSTPSATLPARITVGAYLATRLAQLGAPHLFGLPGDFNLSLLDEMLAVHGVEWIGTTNELNAAYAADGYARIRRGIGALVTTFGVGELSAINGVAGSFAEDVPVVQITGMPSTTAQTQGALLHHTLADGVFDHFVRAYDEVTAASVVLKTQTAPADIDRLLLTALTESKPVYIGVPADVAVALVSSANLRDPLERFGSSPRQLERFAEALREAVYSATSVTLLVGPRVHRASLEPVVRRVADASGVYVATQSGSKAILDESHPASLGTYLGAHTRVEAARRAVDEAPLLILAGTVLSDLLTGFFTHRFDPDHAVELATTWARVGETTFFGVSLADSLRIVDDVLQDARLDPVAPISLGVPTPSAVVAHGEPRSAAPGAPAASASAAGLDAGTPAAGSAPACSAPAAGLAPAAGAATPAAGAATPAAAPLDHETFWRGIEGFLAPDTTLIAEAGTSFFGAIDLTLPDHCDLLGQPIWSSIGFTLPATLGVCVAAPEKRAVLLIGDGSAQLTIQELATMLHRGHTPVIFVLNNGGYTIERAIQSPYAVYQDVTPWNYTALPTAFGAPDRAVTATVRTEAELVDALALATRTTDKLVLVEVVLPALDSPRLLRMLGAGLSSANAPGIQSPVRS